MSNGMSKEELVSYEIAVLQIQVIDKIREKLNKEDLGIDELVKIITDLDSMTVEESYEFD